MKVNTVSKSAIHDTDYRIDAAFHLSDGRIHQRKVNKNPYKNLPLNDVTKRIFSGNIFKRLYVENSEVGYHYLTASDMVKSNIETGKYISKKYTAQFKNLKIEKDWILLSCSGTLGNTTYTNEDFEKFVGTHDLIRIIPDTDKIPSGYLYAFLSSKFGYSLLTQFSFGGVIKHIEPHHLFDLPVPLLPEPKQQQIHQLIMEASELRVEANKLLKEAHLLIEKELNINKELKQGKSNSVKISEVCNSHQKRFETNFYKSEGSFYKNFIMKGKYVFLSEVTENIFRPGIFKRNYVANGVDFLGGSDITKAIPDSDKKLSKSNTSNFNDLVLKEDWILVTCGGTIGTVVYVNNYLSKKLASQHILRVIPKELSSYYLFAFLSSEIGQKLIQSFTYGSVIPQIEPHHLRLVPIPILENQVVLKINNWINKYKDFIDSAISKENQAIDLIEKEIDAWQ